MSPTHGFRNLIQRSGFVLFPSGIAGVRRKLEVWLGEGGQSAWQGAAQPGHHRAPSSRDTVWSLGFLSRLPDHLLQQGKWGEYSTPCVLGPSFLCQQLLWERAMCVIGSGGLDTGNVGQVAAA